MNTDYDKKNAALFGEILKKLRKEHRFSQTTVAEYIGVERSTYAKYELGRLPDVSALARLAFLYDISADSIISVFYPDADKSSSRTVELGSDNAGNFLCLLTKDEQLLLEYYRNIPDKTGFLNSVQNSCLVTETNDESEQLDS